MLNATSGGWVSSTTQTFSPFLRTGRIQIRRHRAKRHRKWDALTNLSRLKRHHRRHRSQTAQGFSWQRRIGRQICLICRLTSNPAIPWCHLDAEPVPKVIIFRETEATTTKTHIYLFYEQEKVRAKKSISRRPCRRGERPATVANLSHKFFPSPLTICSHKSSPTPSSTRTSILPEKPSTSCKVLGNKKRIRETSFVGSLLLCLWPIPWVLNTPK